MNDNKFKRLSDKDMDMVSGGKTFKVRHKGGWKAWEVVDENNDRFAACFSKSGAYEKRDELEKTEMYITNECVGMYGEFNKNLNENTIPTGNTD